MVGPFMFGEAGHERVTVTTGLTPTINYQQLTRVSARDHDQRSQPSRVGRLSLIRLLSTKRRIITPRTH